MDPTDLLDEYAAATLAMDAARERHDFIPLAERLRNAAVSFPDERALAADILAGKLKRPKNRPADPRTRTKILLLALDVAILMDNGKDEKAAVSETMAANGVSESTVRNAVQAFPALRVIKSPT